MLRRIILLSGATIFILLGLSAFLKAQNVPGSPGEREQSMFILLEQTKELQAGVEKIRSGQEARWGELSAKLDQILSNQDRILKQLDVIRMRSSRGS